MTTLVITWFENMESAHGRQKWFFGPYTWSLALMITGSFRNQIDGEKMNHLDVSIILK